MTATVVRSSGHPPSAAPSSHPDGGPRIAFFSSYWLPQERIAFGASDYWRLGVPAAALAGNGWNVMLANSIAQRKDGTMIVRAPNGSWFDDRQIIVMQRWMGEDMAKAIKRARAAGQLIVNDLDDMYWALPVGHEAHQGTDSKRHPGFNRTHYRNVLKASSLVTVSTPYLRRALERWGPPVEVVRNYINLFGWRPKPPGKYIGWVGAVGWRDADLSLLRDTVVPWMREHDETFYHGGHMNRSRSVREMIGYDKVTIEPGRPLEVYPLLWNDLRIALIPLVNSTFNAAKSWVKGLEACARGIPFIVSDHPEYRELGVGRIVERPRDWARHLDELQDPEIAEAEGMANRARARELAIDDHWQDWDVLLREALRVA